MGTNLSAGVAREIITPKLGIQLAGYPSDHPSDSVHDDLTATAFLLESGQTKVLFLGLTIIGVSNEYYLELSKECGEAAGVPAKNVVISCVHTHSGPLYGGDDPFDYYGKILKPKLISVSKTGPVCV